MEGEKTRHITVVIPEDSTAEEGDFLEFNVNGHNLSIPVPAGAKPGDAFEVIISEDDLEGNDNILTDIGKKYGDDDDDDDDDEYETLTVDLFDPSSENDTVPLLLDISPILSSSEDNVDNVDDGDCTHSVVWHSGILLAKYLSFVSSTARCSSLSASDLEIVSMKNKSILELGSGLGVAGLAACVVGAKKVVFTDVPGALPALSRNVNDAKQGILEKFNPNVETIVQPLIWNSDNKMDENMNIDTIIGADLIYDPNCDGGYEPLAKTIASFNASQILIAVRWRKPDLERKFFELMEKKYSYYFEMLPIPTVENDSLFLPCSLSWKEYGNPECEAYKNYFQSTMVTVAGKETIPLAEITNEQIEQLTDTEFSLFEAFQTQIYKGIQKSSSP